MRWGGLLVLLVLAAASIPAHAEPAPLRLLRITPAGENVPPERQIVFQFDRDVVPLGRMQRTADEVPISIEPDPGCEWRWIDRTALACQLGESTALAPATRYVVTVRPGITASDGATLAEEVHHVFVTQRPAIENVWGERWLSPGTPVVRVIFNQEVEAASLARHLSFRPRNGEHVPAEVARPEPEEGEGDVFIEEEREPRPTLWVVQPTRELPQDTEVALHVEPGVRPVRGQEPGVESRDVLTFRTFPAPRLLGVRCWSNDRKQIWAYRAKSAQTERACDPQASVQLVFSSPVGEDVLKEALRIEPGLSGDDPWSMFHPWSRLQGFWPSHEYPVALPGPLVAAKTYRLRAGPPALEDQFGRPLVEAIDVRFRTDHRRPELRTPYPASVLESQVPTALPIVVQNLDSVTARFDVMDAGGVTRSLERKVSPPHAQDVAYRFPLPVREWLGGRSGAALGRLTSDPPMNRVHWFFTQVTPFHVHVKVGHFNTLVWVTDLATGEPVDDADVEVFAQSLERFEPGAPAKTRGTTDRDGLAELAGAAELDPTAELISYGRPHDQVHLMLRVQRGEDLALVPLARDFHVEARGPQESWIQVWRRARHGHLHAWGATAQGIYRTGDRVQFKIWVRNRGNETLEPAPANGYALRVVDPLDRVVYEGKDLALDAFGALDGEVAIPASGAVGWYRFDLTASFAPDMTWQPLSVLVSDFTPAPFRVTTDLDGELFRAGEEVTVTTTASLHAGGPYGDADTRVTAIVRTTRFTPVSEAARDHEFSTGEPRTETIHQSEAPLDAAGERVTTFSVHAEQVLYGELAVESAVRDDRGTYVASRAVARYAGRDRYVGVRQPDWVLRTGEPAEYTAVVTDEHGRIVEGVPIEFTVERLITRASRVRSAGNAYLTRYLHEWEPAASCSTVSAAEPVSCSFTPEGAGEHRLRAEIVDTQDRPVSSEVHRWVAGRGAVVWEEPPGHHLQLVAEKTTFEVGDTARYLIKNPFPGARALVTLERSGVIRRWLTTLEGSTPILEFPIEPELIPGFHVSVLVISPRVDRPPNDEDVDLGKPAFRLGYAQAEVRDPYKELDVRVRPESELLRPRDRAVIEIEAATRQGAVPPMQFAVAVLDEAVLDLLGRGVEAFDPYRGMYQPEPLDLWNFNLLKNLIGIQAFPKKGATPGGDGGMDPALRSLFKFVSYWNPALIAGDDGRARIEFEVPDNLTAWRVLVMAATAEDRFGLGQATFRVNRPTELRAALPNRVIEGDRFEARFTLMNRTDERRRITVSATAEGSVHDAPKVERRITAEPFKRYTVSLPIDVVGPGEVRFEVRAHDKRDRDGLSARVPVGRIVALETAATHGSTTDNVVEEALELPEEMRTDVGHVAVNAAPTVIGGLDGAFRYMREYPYGCWEQRLSRAVMAAHYLDLREWLPQDLEWPGAEALPQTVLDEAANFQTPSGAFAFFDASEDHASPYLSAYTALAFQWLRASGYAVPSGVEDRLFNYLDEILRRDALPANHNRGMVSSVRAVALAALARADRLTLAELTRHRAHVEEMSLFGRAHWLQALNEMEATEELRAEARASILAHAQESAGKIAFSESLDDGYEQLLHSEPRTACALLEAWIAQGEETLRSTGTAEVPMKIVRWVTQSRERRDHWENTQENLFCTAALASYARAYEAAAPDFTVRAEVDGEELGRASFNDRRATAARFERPLRKGDPGRATTVRLTREGSGRLYYDVALAWSPLKPPSTPTNAGIEVHREYSVERDGGWHTLEPGGAVKTGELLRVDLFVSLPAPRHFVVIDDPLPGGLEPVQRELATSSEVDADAAESALPADSYYHRYDDWLGYAMSRYSFHHRELRHDAARFYSDWLPAGRYHLSYAARVIAPGTFTAPPTHAEEMYDPDVFGNGVFSTLEATPSEPE